MHPEYRGQGLGSWLMEVITLHPSVLGSAVVLWTTDKVEFYESCGFRHEDGFHVMRIANKSEIIPARQPNQALQRMNMLVTDRAPSSTLRAKHVRR